MGRKLSAGILLYRIRSQAIHILLVHPGGPFWAKKDDGAWSIPKGEYDEGADALEAAKREFHEETGCEVSGETVPLIPVRQPSGKVISVWAVEGDIAVPSIRSTSFRMEWPPESGKFQEFPEVDRAEWFDLCTAHRKILPGQRPFLAQLEQMVQNKSTE
ncbi:MAG: NUDIX domain-containing protein [Nitrospira sp.]|nr:NUDIX domain-containing protein [Nitrospira sp.]